MIKKILVAQDASAFSVSARRYAVYLAGRFGAVVTGLHVIDSVLLEGPFLHDIAGSMGFEPYLDFSSKMRGALEEKGAVVLGSFEEACEEAGVLHEVSTTMGIVANEICEKAKVADLIVMGRRGVNAEFESGLLGSTTESVVRKASRPALIVPGSFAEPASPLLAYDGSENAARAMHSAAEWAGALGLKLTVVSVSKGPEGEAALAEAQDYLKPYGIETRLELVEDDPPVGIEKFYRENGHDLLFMGAARHSRLLEMVLGSTTEHVMRSVEGPFLLER